MRGQPVRLGNRWERLLAFQRSLVTATKTRKKQQTELITKALQAQDDKKREERENFLITTIPITLQAAYEPSPVGDDHDEGK